MNRKIVLAAVVTAIVAYTAFWEGCFGACSYITDSVYYMRFAERILGNGVDDGWFATWPIGYPAVIAASRGITGLDVFIASKLVGVGTCIALLAMFWKFARSAFVVLALGLVNLAFLKIWRSTLSEQCFIPAMVLLGFAIVGWMDCSRVRRIMVWAVLFILVFLFRYVGVFAPVWVAGAILFSVFMRRMAKDGRMDSRDVNWLLDVSLAGCLAWCVEGCYFFLNRLHTGCFSGMERVELGKDAVGLMNKMIAAYGREIQSFAILSVWVLLLWLLSRNTSGRGHASGARGKVALIPMFQDRRILFFLGMGIMYYLTMASLSLVGNFNELGFRLLYPGTIMAVIGISIAVAEQINVDGWLASLSSLRFSAYLLVAFVVGCNLLSAELGIRRLLGVSVYSIGEPYQQKKLKLTEKYGAERSGSTVVLKGLGDPDFFIGCLRPDLYIEFPKGCKRY